MGNQKEWVCCICGMKFTGWGNNPWPIVDSASARCCDTCNITKVIPARINKIKVRRNNDEEGC